MLARYRYAYWRIENGFNITHSLSYSSIGHTWSIKASYHRETQRERESLLPDADFGFPGEADLDRCFLAPLAEAVVDFLSAFFLLKNEN